ncbi:major facilitator superfamily domain-containing protein [Phyllosticta citriasiana]|uniref:major facilitator superfamily domain-containing protein n=1 Tax=Phyllosticta citriasiana TaxID=595635 RepID=UPI0030FDAA4B
MGNESKDLESGRPAPIPWFKQVFDQGVVTDDIVNASYSGSGTDEDPFIVTWIQNDPRNPMQWSQTLRWLVCISVAISTLAVAFVSSAYSGGVQEMMMDLGVGKEVAILGVSLFVLGFAIGPLVWAPCSELFGRQIPFLGTYAMLTAFNAGAAGSQNIQTLIILRFFAGAFGSSPLTNAGGVVADCFAASERGLAMSIFSLMPSLGPVIGPIVGGFVGESVGWRWIEGVMAIFTAVVCIACGLIVPETYAPVLLRKRAQRLSKMTGKVYRSKADHDQGKVTLTEAFKSSLSRPWILLFREPIVLLLSIYMAIIYGTLYMMFAAFPIVYQQVRGWSQGIGGLSFLGVAVGMFFSIAYSIYDNKRYIKAAEEDPSGFAPPEARLPPCIIGAFAIPIGLFWFAWTNYPGIHWIASVAAGAPFGFGMVLVFLSIMNYLIDAYTIFAASVLAANAVLRSLFGAAFPLFTSYMYADLGIHWASSIPAFLALACVPFPFLFYKYGPAIRTRCKFAAESAAFLAKLRATSNEQDDSATEDDAPPVTGDDASKHSREEDAKEREAEAEAEAIDYSYDDESHQPQAGRFATIKSEKEKQQESERKRSHNELRKKHSAESNRSARSTRSARTAAYDNSPYDIDRVNTHESFAKPTRSRTNSVGAKAARK